MVNLQAAGGPLAPAAARGVAVWRLVDRIDEAATAGNEAQLRGALDQLPPAGRDMARRAFATLVDRYGRAPTAQLAAIGAVALLKPLVAAGLGLHERDALGGNAANAAYMGGHTAAERLLTLAGAPRLALDESPLVGMVRQQFWPMLATHARSPRLVAELGGADDTFMVHGPSLPCTHRLVAAAGGGVKQLPLTLAAQFGHRPPGYVAHLFGELVHGSFVTHNGHTVVGLLCAQPRLDVVPWVHALVSHHPYLAQFSAPFGYTPLHLAAGLSPKPDALVSVLLRAGALLNQNLPLGIPATPLTLAASFAPAPRATVALFLRHGAVSTSLDLCATMRRPRTLDLALITEESAVGGSPWWRTFGDRWPQHTTPTWRPVATLLCARGVPCRLAAARSAIDSGHQVRAKLRFLIRHGADLRERDRTGMTWLNLLLSRGDRVGLDVVADTILAGADVHQPGAWTEQEGTGRGYHPVHVAARTHPDPRAALALLARHGADLWAHTGADARVRASPHRHELDLTPDDLLARRGGHNDVRAWLAARPVFRRALARAKRTPCKPE